MDRAPANSGLTFRIDGLADPARRVAMFDLLLDIFGIDLGRLARLGEWHPGYRAFSWMEGEIIAANVSSRPLPLVIGGREVEAGQIHAVATRPAYRRQGLFKDLMRRVLDDADTRFDCVLLYTEIPELYRPFGFRPLAEHRFRGHLDIAVMRRESVPRRDLSLDTPGDLAILRAIFRRRQPVSRHLGLCGNEDVFLINALAHPGWRLTWLPDEDAVIVWDRADGMTRLHDIVAGRMPSAAALTAALQLDDAAPKIEVLFPPDLVAGRFVPVPHIPEDNDILCVRGPFAIEGTPFMLPLTAAS